MPGIDYKEKNSAYLKMNPTWHVEDSAWKAKQIINMVGLHLQDLKTIAEVGCGAGEILNQLHMSMPDDVIFTGYDISQDANSLANQRAKDRLYFKNENFIESNARYDLLLMIDVFEHIVDYLGFLKSCKNRANYVIFHIPLEISVQAILRNKLISSRQSVGHLHYFTKETAIASLVDSGFEIIDYYYTSGSLDQPSLSLKSKIGKLIRRVFFTTNKDLAAKLLGGFSLLVLAK